MAKAKRASAGRPPSSKSPLGWIVAAITLLVFSPALGGEFLNWDDDVNFLNNPNFRGLAPDNLSWAFSTFLLGHYHPLTWLTLEIDYSLWGMDPRGYHFTNAALHAASSALVYLLFVELIAAGRREEQISLSTRLGAAAGALFWALHPLRVESAAWISERRDVLCGLFAAATLVLYVRGRRGLSMATFAAALGSKIVVATLPFWLLLLDRYPLRRGWTSKTLMEKAPFFGLALLMGIIAVGRYEAGVSGAVADLDLYTALRAMLALAGPAFYLWKTAAPFGLYAEYVYSADPQPGDWPLVLGAAVTLGITAAAVALRNRFPALLTAWGVYVIALLPTLSVFRLDRQQPFNDHHSYLAALACAAIAGGLWAGWESRNSQAARAAGGFALIALAGLTVRQIGFWSDSQTLWARTAVAQPESIIAHNNLGRALAAAGDSAGAMASFQRAIEIEPEYAQANYNLGLLLTQQGRHAEAEAAYERALVREPRNGRILTDLGNSLLRRRKIEAAVARYEEAIEVSPELADAHFNLGLALELLGRAGEARRRFRRVTELDPSNQEAWRRLGE